MAACSPAIARTAADWARIPGLISGSSGMGQWSAPSPCRLNAGLQQLSPRTAAALARQEHHAPGAVIIRLK
jgi:hypothetical protein